MTWQTFVTLRRYLRWIQFLLVLLFLFVQLMPRALGQRELSNKSPDANGAIPSVTQASPSSPLFNCTGKRYLIDEIGSFFFELGTTDTGNHCDDCDTLISLPFPYILYNQTFTSVYVNSNGRLDFLLNNDPAALPTPACHRRQTDGPLTTPFLHTGTTSRPTVVCPVVPITQAGAVFSPRNRA
jgi:hypothetical protein